jgi:hypothetical protein
VTGNGLLAGGLRAAGALFKGMGGLPALGDSGAVSPLVYGN